VVTNLTVQSSTVKSLALLYDSNSKPELRFTLVQMEKDWPLYLPCCAVGSAAERLAGEIEEGQYIILTSAKLCYRKRSTKLGEQSRLEILVWAVDRLSPSPQDNAPTVDPDAGMSEGEIVQPGGAGAVMPTKKGRARYPKHLREAWNRN
jgi:hypothetical protein